MVVTGIEMYGMVSCIFDRILVVIVW